MKKVLLFLIVSIIGSICYLLRAQDKPGFEKSFLYVDANGKVSDPYFDFDFSPADPLEKSFLVGEHFCLGHYYTLNNEKISGLLKYSDNGNKLIFKTTQDTGTGTRIKPEACNGFVIAKDSFAVIDHFYIEKDYSNRFMKKAEYASYIGKYKDYQFYKHIQITNNGRTVWNTYMMRKGETGELNSFPNHVPQMKKLLSPLLTDMPDILEKVGTGGYAYQDLPHLVKVLNYRDKCMNKKPVYFSSSLNELEDSTNYVYTGTIEKYDGKKWTISYQNKLGDTLMVCQYSKLLPMKKDGVCKWYYPNGQVRKIVTYSNGKIKGLERRFYENGQIHYDLLIVPKERKESVGKWLNKVFLNEKVVVDDNGIRTYSYVKDGKVFRFSDDVPLFPEYRNHMIDVNKEGEATIQYFRVFDRAGNKLIDENGNGQEVVFDVVRNRKIYREYRQNELITAYYQNESGNKVYQYCESPVRLSGVKGQKTNFNYTVNYPSASLSNQHQGISLVCFVVNEKGMVVRMTMEKEVDEDISKAIINYWNSKLSAPIWKVAKNGKEKVAGEMVISMAFFIKGYAPSSSPYYNYWGQHQMWMHHNMMQMNQPKFTPPTNFGGF